MSKTRESQKRKLSGKESEDRTLDIIEGTSKGKDETSTCKENQGTLNSEGKTGSPRKRSRLKDKRPSCKNGAKNGDNGNWISNDETVSRSKDRTQNGEDENQSGQDQTKSTDTGTSTQDKEVTLNKLSHSSDNMDRKPASVNRLPFSYFDKDCVELAKSLLGQKLVHFVNGKRLVGKIVETEAYVGLEDKAAHSYNGKRTARNKAMFMAPGTAYVYNIYGMYCCLNISSKGEGAAVLLRALEPLENLCTMDKNRTGEKQKSLLKNDGKDLCNGPSKLCRALAITKETTDQVDMCTSDKIWLEKGETVKEKDIVKSKRINISYGEEWVDKLLRFYLYGNKFISVKDKEAEKLMTK